jgi:ABC-type multidrug transport system fused ATPase/permease subunit
MGGQSHWRALLGLVTPHRKRLSIMIGVLSVAGALPLLGPLLIASFIDEAEAGAVRSELLTIAGIYVGVGIARQILSIAVAWTATDLSWRVTNELRLRLTRHVLNLDLAFHRSTSPGELVSRVDGDVTALSDFIASFAVKAAAAMVTLVGLVVVLLFRDWQVGLGLAVYLGLAISTKPQPNKPQPVACSAKSRND